MKIIFTGGGTGGHFYPIIAIAQKVNQIIDEENILNSKLYYFSDSPYDKQALFEAGLIYKEIKTGKLRTYFSIKNFFDFFKTGFAVLNALIKVYSIYPDVVFGKGGYASFPTIFAARILRIPVIIHESDSAPGRVNKWAGKFATKIALSFKEAGEYFPKEKTAWIGQPIRIELQEKEEKEKALEYFDLSPNIPTVLVLGGSQGAELINNAIVDALPKMLEKYQVIHQTGVRNFELVKGRIPFVIPKDDKRIDRYKPIAFLNALQMKNAAGASDFVISRAGSALFEIANWGIPAILIPITKSNLDHQRKNAYNYARAGGCIVIEEANLTANIINSELNRIMDDQFEKERMSQKGKEFAHGDAARKIAEQIIKIVLSHEQ